MTEQTKSEIPHVNLLCMDDKYSRAFDRARASLELPDSVSVQLHSDALKFLPPAVKFDLVVSPANSYGRLDGGFDDAISRAFSPRDDYLALTRVAQAKLYDEWRGFAPPGSCTLVRIPDEFAGRSKNVWGTRYLGLCPTMRVPQDVRWDREVVYETVWSLLCAIDRHNRRLCDEPTGKAPGEEIISSILITPLATGTGRVSDEKWARQFVLALKHFVAARERPDVWSQLDPATINNYAGEVKDSWVL